MFEWLLCVLSEIYHISLVCRVYFHLIMCVISLPCVFAKHMENRLFAVFREKNYTRQRDPDSAEVISLAVLYLQMYSILGLK
jgi:hypothetical protein